MAGVYKNQMSRVTVWLFGEPEQTTITMHMSHNMLAQITYEAEEFGVLNLVSQEKLVCVPWNNVRAIEVEPVRAM